MTPSSLSSERRNQFAPLMCAFVLMAAPAAARAHPGIGIVRDSKGNIYYTDLSNVWKQTPDGRRSIAVANVHTHELYISAGDTLFGEHVRYKGNEQWGHYVWRRSPSGVFDSIVKPRSGLRDDYDDVHFVRDETGAMYWADISPDSAVIRRRIGSASALRVGVVRNGRPGWMTASNGSVYCVAAGVLYQFDARGAERVLARGLSDASAVPWYVRVIGFFTDTFRERNIPDHNVGGVWLGRDNSLFVAVPGGGVVKRVSPRGDVAVVARSISNWTVVNGLMLPDGDLLLLETGAGSAVRTRRITP